MKQIAHKNNRLKLGTLFALILVIGIICWLAPTKAEAIPATAVTLTATDGSQTVMTVDSDASGTGYSWDAETSTLTLNGYSGRSIATTGDLNLHLIGDNTLTLDPDLTNSGAYGLNLDNADACVTVTADECGTLNIVGDIKTYFSAVSGTAIFKGGTFNIDVTTSSSGPLYAFERNVSFDQNGTGEVEINVNIERTAAKASSFVYGFYNGINIVSRENVTVNVDLQGAENDTVIAITDLYLEHSAPRITVSADNNGGYSKLRKAVGSINSLSLTEGGRVELHGVVGMYSIGGGINANTVTTTPANNNYIWIEYDNTELYSNDFILSTLDGQICENTVFEYQEEPAELKWVGDGLISIPAGKIDDNASINLLAAIRGLATYQAYYLECKVVEGQLPDGLYIAYQGGVLNGQFSTPCEAGSVTIRLREINSTYYDQSDDRTVEFTLNYGAVVDKDRFLTVGNSDPVEMRTDGAGAGWSYDGETKTLTLNGYNGGPIVTEGVLNLHLEGDNTITLTDENPIGIQSTYSSKEIRLSADAGGTLNINTPNNYTKSFIGIDAALFVSGGTVNMNLASDFTGDSSFAGIAQQGYLGFIDSGLQKNWNVTLRNNNTSKNKVRLYGNYNNGVSIENCGDVEMNIDIRGGECTEIHALYSVNIYNSFPDITVFADNQNGEYDCFAIDGLTCLTLSEGGRLDLVGKVYAAGGIPYARSPYTVTTTPQNNNYYWKDTNSHYYREDFWMADLDGNILDRVVFEYSAEPAPLKWVGGTHFDIPAGAVGDYIGLNLWAALAGANSPTYGVQNWVFEIIEGKLPTGIDFSSYPVYNGKLDGQITAPCTPGFAKIRATDKAGTPDTSDDRSVEFTISYGAFSTNNPVSGLEISKDTITLDANGTGEILATVTPADAAYPYVEAILTENARLLVTVGEPVNGVSVITIQACGDAGTYTVNIRTVELGITKTLTVYVKEPAPTTYINYFEERIYGFEQGTTYKISGDGVSTLQFIADAPFYAIPAEWFGKTLNIVKENGQNGNCDSAVQILDVPARPVVPSGITTSDSSSYDSGDGKLAGLEEGMQYKPSAEENWYNYWTPSVSVEVGSYDVRYGATNHSFASEKITVSIGYSSLAFEDRDSFDIPAGYSGTTNYLYVSPGVSGGKEPYVYTIEGPDWITIDEEGRVSVVRPAIDVAATTATITVTDGDGDSKSITINVGAVTVPHTCVFDQKVTTDDYKKSSATCTNKAVYHYSCTCGALSSATFEHGSPLGHNYVEKIVDAAHLREKAADCQSFDTYWYDCTRCASVSSEQYYTTQERGAHKYSEGFDYKVLEGHSHICTVEGCAAKDALIPHTPGQEATEDHAQTCTDCGFVITPKLDHVHKPSDQWNSDDDSHWHDCTRDDGYRSDVEAHKYDRVCDTDCNVCGAVRVPTSHAEEAIWVSNADTHQRKYNCCGVLVGEAEAHVWSNGVCSECEYACAHSADNDHNHKCDVCDASVGTHEAAAGGHLCDYCGEKVSDCADADLDHKCDTCSETVGAHEAATGEHVCGYCGKTVSECQDANEDDLCDVCGKNLASHTHSFGEWKTDAGNHWKECVCGGKSELAAHADNNGDNKCDACGYAMSTHTDDTDGLGTGAIIGIIVACVAVVGVGAFVLIRFAINKKKMR
ncbi:MAG: hypothetical protein IKC97_04050 [Clostridia bacterium]|nr:hypothetical protein [Clostridia bacterium]